MSFNREIQQILAQHGADLVGFADVAGIAPDGYPRAAVAALALPVKVIQEIPVGPTPEYQALYRDYNQRLDIMAEAAAEYLREQGYRSLALTRANAPWDQERMATPLPYKTAATRAGLGWIGKSALLVTPQFGAAVRLTVVLTDAPFDCGEPIDRSRCGECRNCVDACPGSALTNTLWEAGLEREKLVSLDRCRQAAQDLAERTLGVRTTLCGRCFAACPYTQAYVKRALAGK